MVLTQSTAKKYFGNENPIGKTLKVGGTKNFLVTGICKDAPQNSQIQFDFVGSFTTLSASKEEKYDEANYLTYLLLAKNASIEKLQPKVTAFAAKAGKEEMKLVANNYMSFHLEPLQSVHLHSDLDGFEPNGNVLYLYVLGAVALLILIIAGVNYTNLSTAQSVGRSTEVGIRKVLGAARKQVFNQFIWESLIITALALLLALGLSYLLLPYFNQLAGKNLDRNILAAPGTLLSLGLLCVLIAFAAGAYPSFVLSSGKIISILKSGVKLKGSTHLQRTLIIVQFVISIFLIAATVVILQQLSYIQNKDLGYNKEQVIVLPVDNRVVAHYDHVKEVIANHPNIISVGGAYEAPTDIGWGDGINTGVYDETKTITVNAIPVDEDFVKTLGLKIVAGADYSDADVKSFDTTNGGQNLHHAYMLNESAAKALGWTPEEAVGKIVTKGTDGPVKAVVKDFHFRSFHESIEPLVLFLDRRMVQNIFVKVSGNMPAVLTHLESVWKQKADRPFEYHFLDEDFDALYRTEQRTAGLFTTFAGLAVLLACLGLFTLTAYAMVQRTKEMGIRKVLGASAANILALVSKDFMLLIVVAMVIAIPIAWFVMHKWLENFVYKTEVHWWVFALAGLATLFIALATISLQVMKTARANPVKNLRTE
jgi:putative ABC transport system permease protein